MVAGEAAICVVTSALTGACSSIDPARARPFNTLSRSPHEAAREATRRNGTAERARRLPSLSLNIKSRFQEYDTRIGSPAFTPNQLKPEAAT